MHRDVRPTRKRRTKRKRAPENAEPQVLSPKSKPSTPTVKKSRTSTGGSSRMSATPSLSNRKEQAATGPLSVVQGPQKARVKPAAKTDKTSAKWTSIRKKRGKKLGRPTYDHTHSPSHAPDWRGGIDHGARPLTYPPQPIILLNTALGESFFNGGAGIEYEC